ncbi:spheroidene monooxygenase [Aquirufa aurantiipilula]
MQFITIRFLHLEGFVQKLKAFALMGKIRNEPWKASGLLFAKQLGTGGGKGFSIWPDWGTYAFLGIWDSEESAQQFFEQDERWSKFSGLSHLISGWDSTPWKGHGTWNNLQPFDFEDDQEPWNGPVAVITRASIRRSQALRFWMNVPSSSRGIENQAGLIYAKGVGEVPLFEQATFSLWENVQALDAFAYRSRSHAPMIKKTRQYQWYSEEMFVRMNTKKIINYKL